MGGGLYIPAHTWTKGWTRGRTNWVFQGLEGLGGLHSEGRRRITGQVDFNGRCVCAVKKSICPDETVTRQMAKDGMERSRRPVGIEWTSQNFPFFWKIEKWEKKHLETHPRRRRRRKLLFFFVLVWCDGIRRWVSRCCFKPTTLKRHTRHVRTAPTDPTGPTFKRGSPPQNPTLKRNSKKMEKCTWTAGSSVTLFCGGRRFSGPAGHVVIHIRFWGLCSFIFFFLLLLVAYTVLE